MYFDNKQYDENMYVTSEQSYLKLQKHCYSSLVIPIIFFKAPINKNVNIKLVRLMLRVRNSLVQILYFSS